jgi:hypothetical protein
MAGSHSYISILTIARFEALLQLNDSECSIPEVSLGITWHSDCLDGVVVVCQYASRSVGVLKLAKLSWVSTSR